MTTAPAEQEDLLDLPRLLYDLDVVRRHRQLSWSGVAAAAGVAVPIVSDMRNGKRRPSLATYQKLVKWLDPSATGYLLPEPGQAATLVA
jgi:transcriptional regulator with XRE-family HTH domain